LQIRKTFAGKHNLCTESKRSTTTIVLLGVFRFGDQQKHTVYGKRKFSGFPATLTSMAGQIRHLQLHASVGFKESWDEQRKFKSVRKSQK
jgi:hypothetical protein